MKTDYRLNGELNRMKLLHGATWYMLPDDHPDKVRIHQVAKSIEWENKRKALEDIKPWTKQELAYIERNADKETVQVMALELGRPANSIKGQLAKLKIKKNNRRKDFKND